MKEKFNVLFRRCDAVLITSSHNMRYFSGFTGGEGAVVITKEKCLLFTDSRYTEQAEAETVNFDVIETNDWMRGVSRFFARNSIKAVAFEDDSLSMAEYERLNSIAEGVGFVPSATKIRTMRMVKTTEELDKIRKAEELGCRAFEHILGYIKPGVQERDIALEIEYFMKKNGASGLSFDTIAISGTRTSLPHGVPTDKKVEKGDFVTMDFGCVLDGYCSDMTRTIVVGKANEEQKKIYETVKSAQQMGLDSIREGVKCSDCDKAARDYIASCGYGQYFRHSLGHGVGLLVHELPNLSPKSDFVLEANMVVSCEPGIYIPGFGGVRIEDLVVVTKDGCKNLTRITKDLIEL